ncbi:hypothetical protein PsAD2_00390 [Pseudovibrio axinellae]|uniref:DUF1223 domain-containing protein n=1 Tax=Pseudovibrio axinellae TaxID=989403 RepID=A0A166AZX2_9HYPH|nr:DUF1223 domain-containing protein [Pseudovibrio axinellae]KZL21766.1 hypothetical protein PsAD2_00390 [Pseudovibrio axinellae]SEQ22471.1 hypothetical protein SAMN05421798_102182 [Pseudovibrio axinellae]
MRRFSLFSLAIGFFAAGAVSAASLAAQAQNPTAVVELFTSQGCSSCPPADQFLEDLVSDQTDVITLSYHVDYWDYFGWKDTLASPVFTQRQKDYAKSRGDAQVYTPQVVINGLTHMVGSDRDAIKRAIKDASGMSVKVDAMLDEHALEVQLSSSLKELDKKADVYLLGIEKEAVVKILRGENAGTTQTYTNVVRSILPIGMWSGTAEVFRLPRTALKMFNSKNWAVLVQANSGDMPGEIIGAAFYDE